MKKILVLFCLLLMVFAGCGKETANAKGADISADWLEDVENTGSAVEKAVKLPTTISGFLVPKNTVKRGNYIYANVYMKGINKIVAFQCDTGDMEVILEADSIVYLGGIGDYLFYLNHLEGTTIFMEKLWSYNLKTGEVKEVMGDLDHVWELRVWGEWIYLLNDLEQYGYDEPYCVAYKLDEAGELVPVEDAPVFYTVYNKVSAGGYTARVVEHLENKPYNLVITGEEEKKYIVECSAAQFERCTEEYLLFYVWGEDSGMHVTPYVYSFREGEFVEITEDGDGSLSYIEIQDSWLVYGVYGEEMPHFINLEEKFAEEGAPELDIIKIFE
ncbi:MAG: hypothetical protein HDQ99_03565 [Lachnospiraceae bacterium]|nr:hypothetical protein [Lachnospiraceae bacterium]